MNNKKDGFWSKLLGKTETIEENNEVKIENVDGSSQIRVNNFIPKQEVSTIKEENSINIFETPKQIEKVENNYKITAIGIFDENNKILIRTGISDNGEELKTVNDLKQHLNRSFDGCIIKFLTEKDPYTWVEEKEISKIN